MNESLRILTQRIPRLPTIPPVADKIIQLVGSNVTLVNSIVETIEQDPAISAKVLSFSNAAFYRKGGPVTNIRDAVMKIGFDNVKSIALGISLLTIFRSANHSDTGEYENIIRHSMAVGVIAKHIADELGWRNHEEVFTSGLLHDIGMLVIYAFFHDIHQQIIEKFRKGIPFIDAEREVCGVTHADIGAWLADKWKLPAPLCETIRYHHTPSLARCEPSVSSVVHLADLIAVRKAFSPTSISGYEYNIDNAAMKNLGITEEKIAEVESRVEEVITPVWNM